MPKTNYKIDVLNYLMYEYVDFYCDIYLGYPFFKIMFVLSNTCYEFSLLNDTFSILFCEEPNCFQWSFVTIQSICIVIINETVVQIVFCERKCKSEINIKNSLTNNCNTMMDPVKIIFQLNQCWIWRYVKQRLISIFFLKYFIW